MTRDVRRIAPTILIGTALLGCATAFLSRVSTTFTAGLEEGADIVWGVPAGKLVVILLAASAVLGGLVLQSESAVALRAARGLTALALAASLLILVGAFSDVSDLQVVDPDAMVGVGVLVLVVCCIGAFITSLLATTDDAGRGALS